MRRLVVLLLMLSLFGLPAGVASAESGAGTRVDRASARTGTVVLVAENRTKKYNLTRSIRTGNGRCLVVTSHGKMRVWYVKSKDAILGTVYRSFTSPRIIKPRLQMRTYNKCGAGRVLKKVKELDYEHYFYYYGCGITSGTISVTGSIGTTGPGLSATAGATIQCGDEHVASEADVLTDDSRFDWGTNQTAKWKKSKLTTASKVTMCIDSDFIWGVTVKPASGTNVKTGEKYMGQAWVSAT